MIAIPPAVAQVMQDQAFASYPGECCGLLFARAGQGETASRAVPLDNLADRFHAMDPVEYPRTSRDAFMVNEAKMAKVVREAEATGERWIAFYHSHIDCGAYFSAEDKRFAAPEGQPVYPQLYQVVIETRAERIVEARTFRWDGADFAHVATHSDFARTRT
jgi:proteasome lid subunit RPN8/RPN11